MHRWQQLRRQRIHQAKIQQAKPTLKRYSKSREKSSNGQKREVRSFHKKQNRNSITPTSSFQTNQPFHQLLRIFKLQKYQALLYQHGFPQRIKQNDSASIIQQIQPQIQVQDSHRFLSFFTSLLEISTEMKKNYRFFTLGKKTSKMFPPSSKSSNLKKSNSIATKRQQKNNHFRIKSKTNLSKNQVNQTPVSIVSEAQKTVKKSRAKDDSGIVHHFNLQTKQSSVFINKKSVRLLRNIDLKLDKIKMSSSQKECPDFNLYYKQIQNMYISYDSATLTSNISNIDIQQIIQCLAFQIQKIIAGPPFRRPPLNPQKTSKFLQQKMSIKKLIQQSLLFQLVQPRKQIKNSLQSGVDTASIASSVQSSPESQQSQIFDFQVQSIARDLSCFNYRYAEQEIREISHSDIKNFIQLIMMAGKMEKQTPIISYCYLLRVINYRKTDKLNRFNWKNLLLITLIEASKIWDDQSLQNHSFSKVIKPYTTLQINRLERHLLTFLDYNLKIDARQYCEKYFHLRRHAKQARKTANLMPLSLEMIKKLQNGVKKSERRLKQTYKKKLNESF